MHLVFERNQGRFRSNCNILALAWMPYYQETKFRQSLFDYHQKQLINVTRSSAALASNINLLAAAPQDGTSPREFGQQNSSDRWNGATANRNTSSSSSSSSSSQQKFLNARLAEQYQRYLIMTSGDPSSKASTRTTSNNKETDQGAARTQPPEPKGCATINEELDQKYGRMSDFGWLAIGNIGKIVGVTLSATVPPPSEIDGRKAPIQTRSSLTDLILLDDYDNERRQSGRSCEDNANEQAQATRTQADSAEQGERSRNTVNEQLRPDRKRARCNYNLRGHLDEIILVKWNELYQKLATVDSKGNVLIWCKVNEKFTIQTPFYNRSKSVADFKWSNDGKTALICYTDSFVLVGSSSGQRHWHSMLNLDDYHITCASWAPNDEQLLLGVSNGNVVVIDLPHSELTELVVGQANIRTMCWSSCDMNLRHLNTRGSDNDQASQAQDSTGAFSSSSSSPLCQGGGGGKRPRNSAVVNQRRLSRDCSVFARYRFCSQTSSNGVGANSAETTAESSLPAGRHNGTGGSGCAAASAAGAALRNEFLDDQKNMLAIDFANKTIKLFEGGLDDARPHEIEVHLESYLMAWSSDGKVLAVAGFNISTSAPAIGCLRCKYLNHVKFYTQRGRLLADVKLNFTRYPITALTWAHDDRRLFLATGPRLHCARVHFGVPSLSLLAMSCVHGNAKYPTKVDILDTLLRQLQRNRARAGHRHQSHFQNAGLYNWQSFNCPLELGEVLGGAPAEKPTNGASPIHGLGHSSSNSSSSSGGTCADRGATPSSTDVETQCADRERAVLQYNLNISNFQLPLPLPTYPPPGLFARLSLSV